MGQRKGGDLSINPLMLTFCGVSEAIVYFVLGQADIRLSFLVQILEVRIQDTEYRI